LFRNSPVRVERPDCCLSGRWYTIQKVSFFFELSHLFGYEANDRPTRAIFEDQPMNKLLIALFAGAFAFSASALADDSSLMPLSKMDTEHAKQARIDAKAKWDKMTPQEQDAARKAARNKRLGDATAIDMIASENMQYNPPSKEEQAASKAVTKPTKEERQKALKEQEKKSSGQ